MWQSGQSIVLRAPTGAGKTWTVVAPFLHALSNNARFADRLIYALPLRSLASGIHRSVLDSLSRIPESFPTIESSAKSRSYSDPTLHCSLQMGGEKNDPFFESDLVFTTIDQLLSGYLSLPVSLPKRLGSMVAGALIGSAIVIDEAHLQFHDAKAPVAAD
ncbi:MAG: DEAD/DEAH box helicase [Bryobacteraceae bacterium]